MKWSSVCLRFGKRQKCKYHKDDSSYQSIQNLPDGRDRDHGAERRIV